MSALAFLDDMPDALVRAQPLWHVDERDGDGSREIDRVGLFRSRMRMACPGAAIVGIPNAGNRGQRAKNQARREGAAWGFPDMIVLWAGGMAALEWKDGRSQPEDHQRDWLDRLHRMGFPCGVFRRSDSAIAFLRACGAPFIDRVGL